MRYTVLLLASGTLLAQDAWRTALSNVPERPSPGVTVDDVNRIEANARLAAPYFARFTPAEYEENRRLVRRVATFLATVDVMNHDPGMRSALGRAYLSLAALRWAMPSTAALPAQEGPPPPVPPEEPPFRLQAPQMDTAPVASQAIADELCTRYELAAAKSRIVWKSAATLRRNLRSRGMSLNVLAETSLARLQIYFDLALDALTSHDWAEARTNLERAEYETEKVQKVTGY